MLEPCSACLKARQKVKDTFSRVLNRKERFTLVELTAGDITIDNTDHLITAVSREDLTDLVGLKVYLAGTSVIDVAKAKPVGRLGSIVKVTRSD